MSDRTAIGARHRGVPTAPRPGGTVLAPLSVAFAALAVVTLLVLPSSTSAVTVRAPPYSGGARIAWHAGERSDLSFTRSWFEFSPHFDKATGRGGVHGTIQAHMEQFEGAFGDVYYMFGVGLGGIALVPQRSGIHHLVVTWQLNYSYDLRALHLGTSSNLSSAMTLGAYAWFLDPGNASRDVYRSVPLLDDQIYRGTLNGVVSEPLVFNLTVTMTAGHEVFLETAFNGYMEVSAAARHGAPFSYARATLDMHSGSQGAWLRSIVNE